MKELCLLLIAAAAALPAAVSISSDFEGGSIGRFEQVGPNRYRCAVRGEVDQDGRNRQASWYYFRLDGAAGREIVFELTDLPGEYNYRPGNLAINARTRPFISYNRESWTPLADSAVEWDEAQTRLRLRFTPERSPVWIAHVPPYTGSHLSALLEAVKTSPFVTREEIGTSAGGRPIIALTVTNPERALVDKRVIWIMARQHAWETGTSWVVEGALRSLVKDSPEAARLRDRFVFKFFPMADPDGVARGGVRFNAHGYDVNRNWDIADLKRMPEIASLRRAVLDWVDGGRPIDLFLSLHNDNNGSLTGPLSAGGPVYRDMVKRLAALLEANAIYNPAPPRDWAPGDPQPGRADACEGLFRSRGIPTLLLEQNVQPMPRLGRPAGIVENREFGARLVAALAAAVDGRTRSANLIGNPGFTGGTTTPAGWKLWAPREGLRPRAQVIPGDGGNLLSLASSNGATFGKWETVAGGIRPGSSYRFEVWYRPSQVKSEAVSVPIILTWCSDESGKSMVQRDFVDTAGHFGAWRRATRTLEAPARAQSVRVELGLRWTTSGSVVWKAPGLEEVEPLPHRKIRVAVTHLVPPANATVEGNVALMGRAIDGAGAHKPDLVVLSENFVDRGVRQPPGATAQPIPGPATDLLSRKARQYGTYIATSLHEREGTLIYNTAVMIDRQGRIAGKYRKTHLAMIEGENGITPGGEYRVVATDFGRVGMMVCWDNWFSEPARILRLLGADLLVLPIAGDGDPRHWDVISRARAMDNGVYLVSSNTVGSSPSRIIDPQGEVLAETVDPFGVAVAEIDLDRERRLHWLSVGPGVGEARSLYIHERRPDIYEPLTVQPRH